MVRSGFKNLIAFCLLFSAFLLLLNADTTFAGSVTLSWTPPTTNMDGSVLTDLAGFKIYYGTSSGYYTQSIDINNASTTTYQINNLTDGQTYYFAVTAYNNTNNESGYSNMACRTIGTNTCSSSSGGGGGDNNNNLTTGGDTEIGGGGGGCGFIKNDNGTGQKAKGELLSIAMLLLLLFLLRIRKGSQKIKVKVKVKAKVEEQLSPNLLLLG